MKKKDKTIEIPCRVICDQEHDAEWWNDFYAAMKEMGWEPFGNQEIHT
jgi:hypothetical protein